MISETGDHNIFNLKEDNIRDLKRPDNVINKSKDILKLLVPPIGFQIKENLFPNLSYPGSSSIIPQKWEEFDSALYKVTKERKLLAKELQAIERADVVVIQGDSLRKNLRKRSQEQAKKRSKTYPSSKNNFNYLRKPEIVAKKYDRRMVGIPSEMVL